LSQQLGLKEEELLDYGDLTKPDTDKQTFGVRLPQTTTPLPAISPVTPKPSKSGIFEGIKGLATEEGRKAFTTGLEGGYTSPFGKMASKYATSMGLQTMLTPDYDEGDMKGGQMTKPRYYIPGDYNPNYGKGYGEWLFKPGYFADKYPGYADGGMVFQGDERFADGGEVMVSPGAVLPQTITQDRTGLKGYYESLLVPPNTAPRDTSALQAYLDALRARLKRPYQPYGPGTDTGGGGGGGGGGGPGSGGTVTPPGTDPYADGVTGTPIDFIQPPAPPAPPKPREDLTPPSSVAPGATPGDLGDLFGTPPEFFVPGTETDTKVEETEPETETSIEVFDPETIATDYAGAPASVVPGTGLPKKKPPPDQDTETSIEVFDKEALTSDYAGAPASVAPPTGSSFPARTGYISTKENPFGYDFVELGFINPQTTEQVADASKPIVDEILKNFEAQQKAEKEGDKDAASKAAEAGTNLIELLSKVSPEVALAYEAYKYFFKKEPPKEKEKEATYTITEVPDQPVQPPPTTSAPAGGGSAIPWTSGQNYTLRDLINPTESEEGYEPDYSVTIPEAVDFAAGGYVPGYAQGGLGSLQQYAVGGKLVNGRGDGMSDDIKANIGGHQEARLADGEFVIPADVVSHLGNGSTDAGAKQLYAMMDRIRKARTGRERQAPEVEARNYMPA
jgi:hypothetical protein